MSERLSYDDQELLRHLQEGGDVADHAFHELFYKYYSALVRRTAMLTKGDTDFAEEIVQQVFVNFWTRKSWQTLDRSFYLFLAASCKNMFIDHLRSRDLRKLHESKGGTENDDEADLEEGPPDHVKELLDRAIADFPDQQKAIFKGVYTEGKKYQEVADEHGVSINTVKTQLKRSMDKLRTVMRENGLLALLLVTLSSILNRLIP